MGEEPRKVKIAKSIRSVSTDRIQESVKAVTTDRITDTTKNITKNTTKSSKETT